MEDNKYNLITTKLVPVLVIGLEIATVSVAVEECFFDGQDVHSYMLFVVYAAFNLLVGIATIAGFIDYVLNSLETRAIINPTDPVGRKRKVILYMCGIIILLWTGLCMIDFPHDRKKLSQYFSLYGLNWIRSFFCTSCDIESVSP